MAINKVEKNDILYDIQDARMPNITNTDIGKYLKVKDDLSLEWAEVSGGSSITAEEKVFQSVSDLYSYLVLNYNNLIKVDFIPVSSNFTVDTCGKLTINTDGSITFDRSAQIETLFKINDVITFSIGKSFQDSYNYFTLYNNTFKHIGGFGGLTNMHFIIDTNIINFHSQLITQGDGFLSTGGDTSMTDS